MQIKSGQTRQRLESLYAQAAEKAYQDGVDPGNEDELVQWINTNCSFDPDNLFFLVLGIGSALADLIATGEGYQNQVDKIWKERILPNWECNIFGVWKRRRCVAGRGMSGCSP